MSDQIFPRIYLRGLTFSSFKTPGGSRRIQRSVSGREIVVQDYARPIWNFRLSFSFLRDYPSGVFGSERGVVDSELRVLMNFYNDMIFSDDTFLFEDMDDNFTRDEEIGTGDGTQLTFQLVRRLNSGGYPEPIIAPKEIWNIKFDGVVDSTGFDTDFSTGIVTFAAPPPAGTVITSTFTYYFRCRFVDDAVEFERAYHKLWTVKEMRFRSVVL